MTLFGRGDALIGDESRYSGSPGGPRMSGEEVRLREDIIECMRYGRRGEVREFDSRRVSSREVEGPLYHVVNRSNASTKKIISKAKQDKASGKRSTATTWREHRVNESYRWNDKQASRSSRAPLIATT